MRSLRWVAVAATVLILIALAMMVTGCAPMRDVMRVGAGGITAPDAEPARQ